MSARVFNPMVMSEMRRMLRAYGENGARTNASSSPETSDLARVRRDLFGPVDHEDTQRFVERELVSQQTRDADRWGFDFVRESPRKTGPGTARYSWEKVTTTEPVPEPYALRRLPYLQQAAVAGKEDEKTTTTTLKTKEGEPAKVAVETVAKETTTKQTHITDFMKGRKRTFNSASSAKSRQSAPPPSKQARTTPS